MIWIILAALAAVLIVLERVWMPFALGALRFRGQCDRVMAEPGETVVWSGTVENHSRLPIPFARLQQFFPAQAQLREDPRWLQTHYKKGVYQWFVEEKMALRPWQRITRQVRFSLNDRGAYTIGDYRLSAGDLLGLEEGKLQGKGKPLVIIPERSRSYKSLDALGGFLGDISVRRFILEDPILTVGFREYSGREPMKAISWTRTAETGKMQVKQYDHTAEHTVTVLLNVDGANPQTLEECFRLARSVCEDLENRKIPYALRTNGNLNSPVGKLFFLADGLGSKHLNTILYALGRADGTCFRSLQSLVWETLRKRRIQEAFIVITPCRSAQTLTQLHKLENGSGNPVCVLYGDDEEVRV